MDSDLFLVLGLVLVGISAPALFGGLVGGRVSRSSLAVFVLGCGLMAYASLSRPSGYRFQDIPPAFKHVISRYLT